MKLVGATGATGEPSTVVTLAPFPGDRGKVTARRGLLKQHAPTITNDEAYCIMRVTAQLQIEISTYDLTLNQIEVAQTTNPPLITHANATTDPAEGAGGMKNPDTHNERTRIPAEGVR
ncbi:MAG TPA: hypothetical protein VMP11_10825 [Verrucomicrobiae bacterium]|nr:hypothetical protein [Verrucomicrobiae bacterium]